jgi:transcription antitermination factor NusG
MHRHFRSRDTNGLDRASPVLSRIAAPRVRKVMFRMRKQVGNAPQHSHDEEVTEPSWFALGVTARHEKTVTRMLEHKGYETFLPLQTRLHRYTSRVREFELPLFPGYLFCRFDPAVRLPVVSTPGVLQVVGAGPTPVSITENEIMSLRKAVEARIPMSPVPYWQTGQKIRITSGALAGIEGIVSDVRQPVRMVLSVTLLQRSVLLEIDADCVRAS